MSRTGAKTIVFMAFSLASAVPGSACSCAGPTPVCSVYWATSLLFLGHVVRIEHVYDEPPQEKVVNGKKITWSGPGQNLIHFDVAKIYRGSPSEQRHPYSRSRLRLWLYVPGGA